MMEVLFDILRRDSREQEPYRQRIVCGGLLESDTVATALRRINADPNMRDADGNLVREIKWESGCLQRKCGACAMRIDGVPALACAAVLGKRKAVALEPLRKFPVIADLMVDRSSLFEALKGLHVWLEGEGRASERDQDEVFESSRCLQCGCCLEVCPNFYVGGAFRGMAAMVPMTRILLEAHEKQIAQQKRGYRGEIYEGCGKSLACRQICPANIPIDRLLVRSNAIAVWNRRRRKG